MSAKKDVSQVLGVKGKTAQAMKGKYKKSDFLKTYNPSSQMQYTPIIARQSSPPSSKQTEFKPLRSDSKQNNRSSSTGEKVKLVSRNNSRQPENIQTIDWQPVKSSEKSKLVKQQPRNLMIEAQSTIQSLDKQQYQLPKEAQRLINLSFSQSNIINKQDDTSFDIDLEEIMRQTDQQTLQKIISKSLERDNAFISNYPSTSQYGRVGFSQKELPQKKSVAQAQDPYSNQNEKELAPVTTNQKQAQRQKLANSPSKRSAGVLGRSFEFSADDPDEVKDQVSGLQNNQTKIRKSDQKSSSRSNRKKSIGVVRSKSTNKVVRKSVQNLLNDEEEHVEIISEGDFILFQRAAQQVTIASDALADLDWQLSKAKHIIGKYKDLVVKMQLQINAKDYKISQVAQERDNYRKTTRELKETFKKLQQQFKQPLRQSEMSSVTHSPRDPLKRSGASSLSREEQAPLKLNSLLEEVNGALAQQNQVKLIDMGKAKKVMKQMNAEQQNFVEQLLSQLRAEQQMRLQSEEQHHSMMEKMVVTQEHLERQIKMLKEKHAGVESNSSNINTTHLNSSSNADDTTQLTTTQN